MSDNVKEITSENFDKEVLESDLPVLIDFWAEWCGPCKQIAPLLDEISIQKKDDLLILKLNVDENQETPQKYNVRGIPTLMLFKEGNLVDTKIGSLPKSSLEDWINSYL